MSLPKNNLDANALDANDAVVLDRLVDGELTDVEERTVIAQLNEIPDGWRRCALAFLEARCWQRAAEHIQVLADSSHDCQPTQAAASRPARHPDQDKPKPLQSRGRKQWQWQHIAALCALFLFAFFVGSSVPRPWSNSRQPIADGQAPATPSPATSSPAISSPANSSNRLVNNTDGATAPRHSAASPDSNQRPGNVQPEGAGSKDLLLGNVRFVDNSGQQLEVPVYDWNEDVAEQLMFPAQPLPSELYEQLKRHQVRSHRRFVPVQLQDGRQVVVPVQKVEIVPVGGTAY